MLGFKVQVFYFLIMGLFPAFRSLQCYKCYRMETCGLENCTKVYNLVETSYREHFFIENEQRLLICPSESDDEIGWAKLEAEGYCQDAQQCVKADFRILGMSLGKTKLSGVFLGCPKPSLAPPWLKKHHGCVSQINPNVEFRFGIIDIKHKFIDLILKTTLCNVNCIGRPSHCNTCNTNGCIYPNNTRISKEFIIQAPPIIYIIIGLSLIVTITFLLASFCGQERLSRLSLIDSGDENVRLYSTEFS